jgi:hypothetical protein
MRVHASLRILLLAAAISMPGAALGQASGVNPDISAIATFYVCPQGESNCAYSDADNPLNFGELELALQGYLNPYVRGDVFVSYGEGSFAVEEAYASFLRGMGPVQARLGKYRIDWGSVNPLHPHAYSWIFQPLVEERFFGKEGLNQIAANVNASFAAGERGEVKISADLLRGDLVEAPAAAPQGVPPSGGVVCVGPGCADGICQPGDPDCALVYYQPTILPAPDANPELAYHLRASYFDEFKRGHSLIVAVNGLWGTLDPALDRKMTWWGADFKYRWRPDKYRSVNVIGAYLHNRADLSEDVVTGSVCVGPDCAGNVCPEGGVCQVFETTRPVRQGSISTSGWYLIGDWQFAQRWNAGLEFDRSQGLESAETTRRAGAFVNFRLMEETTLFRLLFRREDGDALESARYVSTLEFVFSLGPHRPHNF